MARRTRAREVALQLVYELDMNRDSAPDRVRAFVDARLREQDLRQFALELVQGVGSHREVIDREIAEVAHHWSVSRMTPIDRGIVRLACFELYHRLDIPPKVAIDEAVELARRYGTAESSRFVNGLLDSILTRCGRRELAPSSTALAE